MLVSFILVDGDLPKRTQTGLDGKYHTCFLGSDVVYLPLLGLLF
jgi:hypothetical protein